MAEQTRVHHIKRGIDLPISGKPQSKIVDAPHGERVALLADDYVGMRPRMHVEEGEQVVRGQVLFEDRKIPGIFHTSPGSGTVVAINRGERRKLESVVIELDEAERADPENAPEVEYKSYQPRETGSWSATELRSLLQETGVWTLFRTRPFSRVPTPTSTPDAIFVTSIDTHPLAPDVELILEGHQQDYLDGITALSILAEGQTVYDCRAAGSKIPRSERSNVEIHEFRGGHPAGTPGVHIHHIRPAHRGNTVWHLAYQDVIAIGQLLRTGKVPMERYVALAGPGVKEPFVYKSRWGADLSVLTSGRLHEGNYRVITGSVFNGRTAMGDVFGYLSRFNTQISVIPEVEERRFLGWMTPGAKLFTKTRLFLSRFLPRRSFALNTDTNGSVRALVPIGLYEKVMPYDLMTTFVLRSLLARDVDRAEELGCLELDEEDVSLCSFICPSKIDFGAILRENLTQIEKEG